MKSLQSVMVFVLLAICFATSAKAQDSLSLSRFLQQVESAHPLLKNAALDNNAAEADILSAQASFDVFLKGKYELKSSDGKEKLNALDAGIEMPLATMFGPRFSAGIKRADGSSINPETTTDGATEIGVGISLPLWQGINTDARRTNLEKALLRPDLANISISQERNNIFRTAALRYWDWVESAEQLRIASVLLEIADKRFRQIARRAVVGEVAALDSIEALQEVERRRGEQARAERNAEQAAIAASVFLWTVEGRGSTQRVQPMLLPAKEELPSVQIQADKDLAFRRRPEIRRVVVQERLAELDVNLARELQRPLIEAQGQLWSKELLSSPFHTFKVGLSISQPLLFRSANAQEQLATINSQRVSYQRQIAERQIQAEIDDALSALQKSSERISAAEREVSLATRMQEAEVKRFSVGESNLIFVNIRERALAEAQVRLVSARTDNFRALVSYRWATMSW